MNLMQIVNLILDLVRRTRRKISPRPPSDMKKIALIVGHSEGAQGASAYNGETEYVFNSRIAEKAKNELLRMNSKVRCEIFYRNGKSLAQLGEQIGSWGAALSAELHFNSFKEKASGCEVLIIDQKSFSIADKITDSISAVFGIKERGIGGVQFLRKNSRGYKNLLAMKNNGVKYQFLIEPAFLNFKTNESKAIIENENDYVSVLAGEISKVFKAV